MHTLDQFVEKWAVLNGFWKAEQTCVEPLKALSADITALENEIVESVINIVNGDAHAQDLFARARHVRDREVGQHIDLRAVVDLSNRCRVNCGFCPMRRDNAKSLPPVRATAPQIIEASEKAYAYGFRQLFLQSGEDTPIIQPVIDALRQIRARHADWHVILNLGNHRKEVYERLHAAGGDGYLIKHETANPELHLKMRGEPLSKRVQHMLLARKSGMYIGSGNILGLPGQTLADVAGDLLFLGRIDSSHMVSSAPFTISDDLPTEFQVAERGVFERTLRFIALLRLCFPRARIPATSNLDSPKLLRPDGLRKSGQALGIDAGANGITVQFTPEDIEDRYGLYARGTEKKRDGYLVRFEKARRVSEETGLRLNLKPALPRVATEAGSPKTLQGA